MRTQPIQPTEEVQQTPRSNGQGQQVKIRVEGGVAFVDCCPRGVEVQVTDYDVHCEASQLDLTGRPCAQYVVVG